MNVYGQPDITAPGVNIIGAYSEAVSPTGEPFDKRRIPFNIDSGTSMSCPHVSGVVGLLKTLYPTWSTAAIRSAIMTTGTYNNIHINKSSVWSLNVPLHVLGGVYNKNYL